MLATTEKIGIAVLDSFLQQVEEISFAEDDGEKLRHKDFYIGSIEHLLKMVKERQWDIGMKNELPHFYNGEFWQRIDKDTFRYFLQATGMMQGIPRKVIKDHLFVEKLVKQFASEARFPVPTTNDIPKINLRNCTLHFTSNGIEQKPFDKQDGLTYQLHYDYDPSATATQFKAFLDRVLPDIALQKLLFQYVGYVFLRGLKLDKILFLFGGGANGKSVFLNIIRALIGVEQCCEFSLEGITKSETQRAELGNYLLNVSTEISTRMAKDIFKKIASREPLQARSLYKQPFTLWDYATSVFAMNELPKEVELTDAFFRRFIIIPFSVRIPDSEQDPDLSQKIIDYEMSGVLNYVIEGMMSLIGDRKFDIPASAQGAVNQFQQESDTVASFLDNNGFRPSLKHHVPFGEMYDSYEKECVADNFLAVGKNIFGKRLRKLGFNVSKRGHEKLTVVFAETVDADCADNAD